MQRLLTTKAVFGCPKRGGGLRTSAAAALKPLPLWTATFRVHSRKRVFAKYHLNNPGGSMRAHRRAQSARPREMSLANLLREAKVGACPPLLRSYFAKMVATPQR